MKNLFKILTIICIVALFSACKDKTKPQKFFNDNGQQEQIKIIRFDRELFDKPLPNMESFLVGLASKYPEMFQASMQDKQYMATIEDFITDNRLRDAQNLVQRLYPDLSFLEIDLTSAFARLKSIYPKTQLPSKIFTFMFGPIDFSQALADRVYHGTYAGHDYYTIALDIYSMPEMQKNPYYGQMPQYLLSTLNKDYIAPDFIRMYLQNIACVDVADVTMNPDCTLLDCIIQEGKYSYFVKTLLPNYDDNKVLRYDTAQMNWCQKNEKIIWGYIIQNKILYEKDRSKYMSIIAEGPTTKPLNNSPSRTGNYIGYQIVNAFMKKQNISVDSLMHITNSQQILKQSAYKPKK